MAALAGGGGEGASPGPSGSVPGALLGAKLALYRQDFDLFARRELKIQTKAQQLESFVLRPFQQNLVEWMSHQRQRTGYVRQVWLKNRQIGTTTISAGWIFWRTALNPDTNSIVVAHEIPVAEDIFLKYKRFYENIGADIRPMKLYDTKQQLVFDNPSSRNRIRHPGLASRIVVATSKNIHLGAGGTFHNVHLSEAARYDNAGEVAASVFGTVSLVPGTTIIVESTAQAIGHWFHELCEQARVPGSSSPFEFHFIGYDQDPQCWLPLEPDEVWESTPDERELVQEFRLTREVLKWRRMKLAEYLGDIDLFNREFPLTYEEAWILKDVQVFPFEQLRSLRPQVAPPFRQGEIVAGPKFREMGAGPLWMWEEPRPGKQYCLAADPALGVVGGDNSAIQVLDQGTGSQVAEYICNVDYAEFKDIVYWLGLYYNTALVAVEVNAGGGGLWINRELSKDYPNIYVDRRRDSISQKMRDKTGWLTEKWSKEYAVTAGKSRLYRYCSSAEKNDFPLIRSTRLFKEMQTFVVTGGNQGYAAAPGTNSRDDAVMAWLIANVCVEDERVLWMGPSDEPTKPISFAAGAYIEPCQFLLPEDMIVGPPVSVWGDIEGWK